MGRVFFGIAIAGLGVQSIHDHDIPYMLMAPAPFPPPVLAALSYIFGAFFLFSGAFKRCIRIYSRMDSQPPVLGIFCRPGIIWIRNCNYV